MLGKPKELLGDRIKTRIVNELAKPLREMARNSGSSSTARKALSLIINDLRRQQLVLALHFRSPWF
jgi:hypothetical protein